MTRPALLSRGALLPLLLIAQLAASLSLSSRVLSSAGLLTSLVAPLGVAAAEQDVGTVADAAAAQECTEPGTCSNEDGSDSQPAGDAAGSSGDAPDEGEASDEPRFGPDGSRLISAAELAKHIGAGGASESNPIWLSILGKVYDVTTGEDFYGEAKGSYNFYAGRDASPCFSSGNNTPEGADEKLEEWEDKKLMAVWEWSEFYKNHDTYKYLGVLAGSRYFDEEGNELEIRQDIITRASEAKKTADEERERKKKERNAAREARKRARQMG